MNTHARCWSGWLVAGSVTVLLAAVSAQTQAAQDELQVREERRAAAVAPTGRRRGTESRSVTVRYADLDLSGAAGAHTLYVRLKTAARVVCGPAAGHSIAEHQDWKLCYANALDAAVAQTGSATVAALHGEVTGRAVPVRVASAG